MVARKMPATATQSAVTLHDSDIALVCEALRMMAATLQDASATVHKVMPEAYIIECFADWREQADTLRKRLET